MLAVGWLTNIPGSIVIVYTFGIAAATVSIQLRSLRPLFSFAAAEAGAFGVAGFRLLPALAESRLIQAKALLHALSFRESMLFRKIAPPHAFQYYMDTSAVLLSILLLPAIWPSSRNRTMFRLTPLVVFILLMLFFEEPLSIPAWTLLPQLSYVSFAFRFLGPFSLASAFILALPGLNKRFRNATMILMVGLSLYPFYYFLHNLYSSQRFPSMSTTQQNWSKGYGGMREYVAASVPPGVSNADTERAHNPLPLLANFDCAPVLLQRSPNRITIKTANQNLCTLTLNVFAYPFWMSSIDSGRPVQTYADADGLLSVKVPAGGQIVHLAFLPSSRLRFWTALVSATLFLMLLILALGAKDKSVAEDLLTPLEQAS